MKFLIVANSYWNLYNFRREFIYKLIQNGSEIVLIAPKDDKFSNIFIKKKIPCHFIPYSNLKINIFSNLFTLFYLFFKIRKINPDKIVAFTIKINILVSISIFFSKYKLINNITGLGSSIINSIILKKTVLFFLRISFIKSSIVIFQNHDDRNFFINNKIISQKKCHVVKYFGLNFKKYQYQLVNKKRSSMTFLYLGRIIKDKGIYDLIEAIKIVKRKFTKINLIFVGNIDSNNPGYISLNTIKTWEKKKLIRYYEFVLDIKSTVALSDCIILPSYREGLPKSILEALALGRPAIVTNVVGSKDLVVDKFNGLVCEPKNIQSLANKIIEYFQMDYEKRKEMSLNARKSVINKFNSEVIIKEYINLINLI